MRARGVMAADDVGPKGPGIETGPHEALSQNEAAGVVEVSGVIKWFDVSKGYGFIAQENGPDVFVHHSGIDAVGFKSLKEGDKVTVELTPYDLSRARIVFRAK